MARVVKLADAKDLGLPGRISKEILSGQETAASVTLRYVEIPVPISGVAPRDPHSHNDSEEYIHVLSGRGLFCGGESEIPLLPGDTVWVPREELHVTINTGGVPLLLLCFFPKGDLNSHG